MPNPPSATIVCADRTTTITSNDPDPISASLRPSRSHFRAVAPAGCVATAWPAAGVVILCVPRGEARGLVFSGSGTRVGSCSWQSRGVLHEGGQWYELNGSLPDR